MIVIVCFRLFASLVFSALDSGLGIQLCETTLLDFLYTIIICSVINTLTSKKNESEEQE